MWGNYSLCLENSVFFHDKRESLVGHASFGAGAEKAAKKLGIDSANFVGSIYRDENPSLEPGLRVDKVDKDSICRMHGRWDDNFAIDG